MPQLFGPYARAWARASHWERVSILNFDDVVAVSVPYRSRRLGWLREPRVNVTLQSGKRWHVATRGADKLYAAVSLHLAERAAATSEADTEHR